MPVLNQDRRVTYIASAGETVFTYPFRIFEETDLDVYLNEVLLNVNIDYTVTGVNVESGGTIVLTSPAALNDVLIIQSDVPASQTVDFTVGGQFTSDQVDFVNDKLTVLIQQNKTLIEKRGLLYPVEDEIPPADNDLPLLNVPSQPGRIPLWSKNDAGNLVALELEENPDVTTLRAELASQVDGSDGAGLVGYYNPIAMAGTTVSDQLDILVGAIIPPPVTAFFTGDVKMTYKSATPTGWILMDNGTIGNAGSGATNRANADTEDLYTLLWDSIPDVWAPVSGGRGASAAADFAALKTLRLPLTSGRAFAQAGNPSISQVFTADFPSNQLFVARAYYQAGAPVILNTTGTMPAPLVNGAVYYVIPVNATTIKVASTSAQAVDNVEINLSSNGTGTLTIADLQSGSVLGETVGSDTHVLTPGEIPPHVHSYNTKATTQPQSGSATQCWVGDDLLDTGPGAGLGAFPHSIMQPTAFFNLMIKL